MEQGGSSFTGTSWNVQITNGLQEIAKYFRGKDFMNAPWLFAEAYKYRRLRECFSLSKFWVDYGTYTSHFRNRDSR